MSSHICIFQIYSHVYSVKKGTQHVNCVKASQIRDSLTICPLPWWAAAGHKCAKAKQRATKYKLHQATKHTWNLTTLELVIVVTQCNCSRPEHRRAYYFCSQKTSAQLLGPTRTNCTWTKLGREGGGKENAIMFNNRQAFILTSHFIHDVKKQHLVILWWSLWSRVSRRYFRTKGVLDK